MGTRAPFVKINARDRESERKIQETRQAPVHVESAHFQMGGGGRLIALMGGQVRTWIGVWCCATIMAKKSLR
eukprot:2421404-Pleurochrysis_carterae.AAC.2